MEFAEDSSIAVLQQPPTVVPLSPGRPWQNLKRTADFWARAAGVYAAYKVIQLQAYLAQYSLTPEQIEDRYWKPHNEWAGDELYNMCIDLRGFYLKVGQFIGTRSDFIAEPICRRLSLLQDQVPPMGAEETRVILEAELGLRLANIFEWINLDQPLGSASISQVHKAKLLAPGRWGGAPRDGIVAVKVQYPGALEVMVQDLSNIRVCAGFLQRTEVKFDLVSPVDELARQIRLEFDFLHEARTMDAISQNLKAAMKDVEIPRSIPRLTTPRLLTMSFVEGDPITRLKDRGEKLAPALKAAFAKRLLARVAEAYGRMLLLSGLFQADCHPGNILVKRNGHLGLIDFGQSKQLTEAERLAFARLVLALSAAEDAELLEVVGALTGPQQLEVSQALDDTGVRLGPGPLGLRVRMAYGMFDTRGRVDPFAPDSPMKLMSVDKFPADFFFVLRVMQLLRGMANAMGVLDFSTAVAWRPLALQALNGPTPVELFWQRRWLWAGGLVFGGYQPPAAPTLRLGPSFGIGRSELLMCWGAAYAATATGLALQLLQLAPAMNQAMLVAAWAGHFLLHAAWGKVVTALGPGVLSAGAGIIVTATAAALAYTSYKARPLLGLLLVPYVAGNTVAALLLTTAGLALSTSPPVVGQKPRDTLPLSPGRSAAAPITTTTAVASPATNGAGPKVVVRRTGAPAGAGSGNGADVAVVVAEEESVLSVDRNGSNGSGVLLPGNGLEPFRQSGSGRVTLRSASPGRPRARLQGGSPGRSMPRAQQHVGKLRSSRGQGALRRWAMLMRCQVATHRRVSFTGCSRCMI